jgi:hypothetical protein
MAELSKSHIVPAAPKRAVTGPAIIAAILVILVGVLWADWAVYYLRASRMTRSHFPVALFLPFLALGTINLLIRHRRPDRGLSRDELLVALAAGLAAMAVPYDGLMMPLIGALATPYYFASPENGWGLYLHDHIPTWLVPQNTAGGLETYFEGRPSDVGLAISIWATPLIWWLALILGLAFTFFCVVVILRKQWTEHERLTYPLVEVGRMLSDTAPDGVLSRILRSRLFWIAFGLVMVIKMWNVIGYFSPGLPRIPIEGGRFTPVRDYPQLIKRFSPYAIGFGYFAPTDVLLSVWVFILLTGIEVYAFNRVGYTLGEGVVQWQSEALKWQSYGALLFTGAWSLWMARHHLKAVWRRARGQPGGAEDAGELLSYRTACLGFLTALAFVACWLRVSGMEWHVVMTFVPLLLLTLVGITKVVAELGLAYVLYPVQPYDAVLRLWGSRLVGGPSIVALTFARTFDSAGKGLLMPALSQGVRAVDGSDSPRRIAVVIWVGLVVGILAALGDALYFGYSEGAYNMMNGGFWNGPKNILNKAVAVMRTPTPAWGKGRAGFAVAGAFVMLLLTIVRYRAQWWPLHPVGFAVQGTFGLTKTFFSILIAWGLKSTLLRIGGVALYEKGKPFFIGLLVGQAVSTAIIFGIDMVWFPIKGHNVHNF